MSSQPRSLLPLFVGVFALTLVGASLGLYLSLQLGVLDLHTHIHTHMEEMLADMKHRSETASEQSEASQIPALKPTAEFNLQTVFDEGRFLYVGKGGSVDGLQNPAIRARQGDVVKITVINGDGVVHDLVIEELKVHAEHVRLKGDVTSIVFKADQLGEYHYFCSIPGHRQAGMEGKLIVEESVSQQGQVQQISSTTNVVRPATNIPPPVKRTHSVKTTVLIETREVVGELADNVAYTFWTFNGTVPGPLIRARVGDTLEIHLRNHESSKMPHSVDLHSVTGPGGGAVYTQAAPGESKAFQWKALNPGLYVYHCATPDIPAHVSHGMYGLILVEPEEGLPPVEREFYVMQGDFYTKGKTKETGYQEFDYAKLLAEQPEYVVFNGRVNALTGERALKAKVGETVRIFFGVGGANVASSFHVIGEIFDRVYPEGAVGSEPAKNVQTTLVPAGGAVIVEFKLDVPGRYILVDHSLTRINKGAVGFIEVEGSETPEIFKPVGLALVIAPSSLTSWLHGRKLFAQGRWA